MAAEGYRMNLLGMMGSVELMSRHEALTRRAYDVAVRMRVDIGWPRVRGLMNATLGAAEWRLIARAAPAPVLYTCSHDRTPGGRAMDNCLWSAPPSRLEAALRALLSHYDKLTEAARTPSTAARRKGCLKPAHPESLFRCAMALAGLRGSSLTRPLRVEAAASAPFGARSGQRAER